MQIQQECDELRHKLPLRTSLIRTRRDQLRQIAGEPAPPFTPIPDKPEDWTPLLVPVEKRMDLKVSFDFEDIGSAELSDMVWKMTGMRCDIDPDLNPNPNINLRVSDMSASLALDWINHLLGTEITVNSGKRDESGSPDRAPRKQ